MSDDSSGLVISADKIRRYSLLSLALVGAGYAFRIATGAGTQGGLSRDFLCFWSVSQLSLQGDAVSAFDIATLGPIQAAIGTGEDFFTWSYPPIFQLMTLPLALVPPLAAQVLWCVAGFAVFAFALMRALPQRLALLAISSTALFLTNVYLGQTGIWITAFFLLGTLGLSSSPGRLSWGAAAFGLAAVKPHLGLLIPILLIVRGEWRAFALATAALVAFCIASLLAFGPELWAAFFEMSGTTLGLLNASQYKISLLSSFFSSLRSFGVPAGPAFTTHTLLAGAVVVASIRLMWIARDSQLAAALAICAGLLIFPYVYYYDLLLLAVPLVILVREALVSGWLAREQELLVLLWLGPLPLLLVMESLSLSLGVFFPLLAFFMIARRIRSPESRPVRAAAHA